MKILTTQQIREADRFTIENEPIKSFDLMQRAAHKCFQFIEQNFDFDRNENFDVFCGPGNNGGDGILIADELSLNGLNVNLYVLDIKNGDFSADFSAALQVVEEESKVNLIFLNQEDYQFELKENSIIIDSIFGSGISKSPEGWVAEDIQKINAYHHHVIAIDVPSGFMDNTVYEKIDHNITRATTTLKFQAPLINFFYQESSLYLGNWHILDIGLSEEFINQLPCFQYYLEKTFVKQMVKPRLKFSHKGTFGHGLLVGGSKGKMGAIVLSSKAFMHTGAGLLTVNVPKGGADILHNNFPEAMVLEEEENHVTSKIKIDNFKAIGIGPGMGKNEDSANALKHYIQNCESTLVIDADALNILAENKTWLAFLPPNTILTPHPKEFERLFGKTSNSEERLELLKNSAVKFSCHIVLKGAYSAIATPKGEVFFNTSGNPGMATAGSGDVLTGIISSLACQNYNALEACILGVYLHGIAGDIAAYENGQAFIIASSIIENIGKAYLYIGK